MVYAIYIACVLGAVALLLMMPRRGYNPRKLGALLGAATLGGLWLWLSRSLDDPTALGLPIGAMAYYYVFSAIAIVAAVRVITHDKPVFSALWFVMVVLASAGLFILLSAEFMAFAMVIIYGGAILVTYVFVIMLASQSGDTPSAAQSVETGGTGVSHDSPEYDRVAREPWAAIAAGFLLLAVLLTVMFNGANLQPRPFDPATSDEALIRNILTHRPAQEIATLAASRGDDSLPAPTTLDNSERIGLDLFRSHVLGLELAGVILLVSLVGAVVIARKQVTDETPSPASPTPREGQA